MTGTRLSTRKPPSAAALAEARKAKPRHHPATAEHWESWSVANPYGNEIHYADYDEALGAARTAIY